MPMPPTKSDIDLARKIEYVRLYLGPPIIFLELIVLAFFGRSGSSILGGISRFLVSLPEIYTLGYFTQHMLFVDILPYLKQWLLLVILARRYPELGMQGVVQLCRPDSWCPEMAPEDTEKEMLGEATRVAKVVVSPSSFKYWFFIINGAIYSREPDSPIISGAFQQLLFLLKFVSCGILLFAAFWLCALYSDLSSFGQRYKEKIENARRMQEIRVQMESSMGRNLVHHDKKS